MVLYLDASSLVKLYVSEEETAELRRLVGQAVSIGTSSVSYVEAHSAFTRKRREGGLSTGDYERTLQEFRGDWTRYLAVDLDFTLLLHASQLTERHALRALDAIHLASALFLREASWSWLPFRFHAADRRLQVTAEAEGLEPLPLST